MIMNIYEREYEYSWALMNFREGKHEDNYTESY